VDVIAILILAWLHSQHHSLFLLLFPIANFPLLYSLFHLPPISSLTLQKSYYILPLLITSPLLITYFPTPHVHVATFPLVFSLFPPPLVSSLALQKSYSLLPLLTTYFLTPHFHTALAIIFSNARFLWFFSSSLTLTEQYLLLISFVIHLLSCIEVTILSNLPCSSWIDLSLSSTFNVISSCLMASSTSLSIAKPLFTSNIFPSNDKVLKTTKQGFLLLSNTSSQS
jgi:hypothetical protein